MKPSADNEDGLVRHARYEVEEITQAPQGVRGSAAQGNEQEASREDLKQQSQEAEEEVKEITCSPVEVEPVAGKKRKFVVKVDKGYFPTQNHRKIVITRYAGEVTEENAEDFLDLLVKSDLHRRVLNLFGADQPGEQLSDNLTFNEALEYLLDWYHSFQGGHLPGGMQDLQKFVRENVEAQAAVA